MMEKLVLLIFTILIIFVIFTIFITAVFIRTEYEKSMLIYQKREKIRRTYYNSKKKKVAKRKEGMDAKCIEERGKINRKIDYAMFTFDGENIINKMLDNNKISNSVIPSSKQCLFIKMNDKFLICNLSKTENIFLNGMPVKNVREIKYGDFVEIGELTFQFNNIWGVA